jgi:hypothetical protein
MKSKKMLIGVGFTATLAILVAGAAISAQDRYTLKVPNGLAFSPVSRWCPIPSTT